MSDLEHRPPARKWMAHILLLCGLSVSLGLRIRGQLGDEMGAAMPGPPELLIQSMDPLFDGVSCFSPNRRLLVTTGHSNLIKVWRIDTGQMISQVRLAGQQASVLGFSADSRSLYLLTFRPASPRVPASVWQWNLSNNEPSLITTVPQISDQFCQSPDGRWLALAIPGGGVITIDRSTRRKRDRKSVV